MIKEWNVNSGGDRSILILLKRSDINKEVALL
jgi:hypothetical protein